MSNALESAKRQFGPELVSAYALGSLTNGGFQAEVSDVDLALILREVMPDTARQMQTLKQSMIETRCIPKNSSVNILPRKLACKSGGKRWRKEAA